MTIDTTPNLFVPGVEKLEPELEATIARRQQVMGASYRLNYSKPLHFVRGEGVWLYHKDGTPYLDFYNNVASLGHCHPRVVDAMAEQARTLCVNTRYLYDSVIEYSERLLATFPAELSRVVFACTGSEANDAACRIAENATGGDGYIVSDFAYHGTTMAVARLSSNLGPTVPLGRTVWTVMPPHTIGRTDAEAAEAFTAEVKAALAEMKRRGVKPAALLIDSIFSSDGVYSDPKGAIKEAVEAVRAEGGLFIADEVQGGFARTGESMWSFSRHGVIPDIVTLGKPMGNGYPMSGVVARAELIEKFGANARYFNTFAGNSVAAANGLAVLDVIRDEELLQNAQIQGAKLGQLLADAGDERIAQVRGSGLYWGVEIRDTSTGAKDGHTARAIVNAMRERNVLISLTGRYEHVLKVRPPLVVRDQEIDRFIETFRDVLRNVSSKVNA
ncbi:aspartate aminotransferase family protein [Gemmobacter fulvus]|uniref:aspartate aminotransferase family protein n=1 Tax=Gemmobacter fulvus TaxID=2840474 RepID=UPI0027966FC1|nr:aspartate aminotransferase family protein [Gemmobacter fulvus]MDQ1850617.1 aspartate aminotransferase family protein [Gemmobacter fulvus]